MLQGRSQHQSLTLAGPEVRAMMLFILSVHIVFLLLWSACLLYFPQLVVRQATIEGEQA
jgi:uncharacterized membrane protein